VFSSWNNFHMGVLREEYRSPASSHVADVRCCINRIFCRRRSSGADVRTFAVPKKVKFKMEVGSTKF
jgi:hypothetical protein